MIFMTDKELIKNYKETYKVVAKKPTEKAKKIYLNAFNAFDRKLNKDLDEYLKELDVRPKSLDSEITRIKKVLNALHYRLDVRNKMIDDYKSILGYKPKKLSKISAEKDYEKFKNMLKNLTTAKDIIRDLIISGKEIRKMKSNSAVFKNKKGIQAKIDSLIEKRVKLINLLKNLSRRNGICTLGDTDSRKMRESALVNYRSFVGIVPVIKSLIVFFHQVHGAAAGDKQRSGKTSGNQHNAEKS